MSPKQAQFMFIFLFYIAVQIVTERNDRKGKSLPWLWAMIEAIVSLIVIFVIVKWL
jgi:hypothetical protein